MSETPSWAKPRPAGTPAPSPPTPPVPGTVQVPAREWTRGVPPRPEAHTPSVDTRPVFDPAFLPKDAGGTPDVPFTGGQPWDWPPLRRGEKW